MRRHLVEVVLLCTAAGACATRLSQVASAAFLSPVKKAASPYRRPAFLQPKQYSAAVLGLLTEAYYAAKDQPVARMGVDVEIRPAGRRGLGLFALRTIEAKTKVARYSGTIATLEEYQEAWQDKLTSGAYLANADASGKVVIDAEDPSTAPGRYVNHSRLWCNSRINAIVDKKGKPTGVAFVETTRRVKEGDELLLNYGTGYWDAAVDKFDVLTRIQIDYMP